MKKLLYLLIAVMAWTVSPAQRVIVKNKTSIGFYVNANFPMGPKSISGVPTVLANMKSGNSFLLQFDTRLLKHIYLGASVSRSSFSGWQYQNSDLYKGTQLTMNTAAVVLTLKTEPKLIKAGGKFSGFISIAPGTYAIVTQTDFSSAINFPDPTDNLKVESTRPGIAFSGGVNYIGSGAFGLSLSAGYSQIATKSNFYAEPAFKFISAQVGVFYRLGNDKYYRIPGR